MLDLSELQPQLMLLAGMILLGWILMRRQIKSRRRAFAQEAEYRDLKRQISKADVPTAMPLSTAPQDAQRWQVEMYDLQRELKAELDTKIVVVQALIRQADERISALRAQSDKAA